MSNLQRMLNLAQKALDKKSQSPSTGSGKTDWRDMVRTVSDKVTGDSRPQTSAPASQARPATPRTTPPANSVTPEDRAAIARYDYLLSTAQPQQLEQVHREAFERLTPAQREQVDAQLRADLPAHEQPASAAPADLARAAARGEAHNPGFLKKMFAKTGGRRGGALAGAGVGAVAGLGVGAAGGILAAVAGGAVLSTVGGSLLEQASGLGVDFESLAGDLSGFGDIGNLGELGELGSQASEFTSGLGEQASEFGSNFEIPGLGSLGSLFGRDN